MCWRSISGKDVCRFGTYMVCVLNDLKEIPEKIVCVPLLSVFRMEGNQ